MGIIILVLLGLSLFVGLPLWLVIIFIKEYRNEN